MADFNLSIPDSIQSVVDPPQISQISNGSPVDHRRTPAKPDKGTVERRPQDVIHLEQKTEKDLHEKMIFGAPHTTELFVRDPEWWHSHSFMPGIQVSVFGPTSGSALAPIRLQMFKYLLLESVENTACVFSALDSTTKEPTVGECEKAIKTYDAQARRVRLREETDFMRRRRRCSAIYKQELLPLRRAPSFYSTAIPKQAVQEMDAIFERHYKSLTERLLLGRLDDIAREVNTAYAVEVAEALGKIDIRYKARAILTLRPLYGRGAPLPLMTKASVEAMWEVCLSNYYTVQLKAVSPASAVVERTLRPFSASQLDRAFPRSVVP